MDFSHFLTSYLPDPAYGGRQMYRDMVGQAIHADRLGYRGVAIPEHHLINILLVPSPLQLATHIAALTKRIELTTAIAVLPIRDMRVFAGEVVQAAALTDGRLVLGVGRGAFAYEVARLDTPIEKTKHKFNESLAVLEALLSREEVSWDGDYYHFDSLTVMPRPEVPTQIMLACMDPVSIYESARKGYWVQTTPLQASHEVLLGQVNAFHRGANDAKLRGRRPRLSLQRGIYCAANAADAHRKLELAYGYYQRFDNVFTGPGLVDNGRIRPLTPKYSMDDLAAALLFCEPDEMIDRLSIYAEIGIDEVICSSNFGQEQSETLEMMQRFSEEVIPRIGGIARKAVA